MPADQASPIHKNDQSAKQSGRIDRFHPDQSPGNLGADAHKFFGGNMANEVVEGVVNRACVVVGLGEPIEVGQYLGADTGKFEVELPPAAELEQVQADPPPGHESCGIRDRLLVARIHEAVEFRVEVGKKVANGLNKCLARDQSRPL
jgi:hypothetical protein